jgi:hypothetical protein
MHEDRCSERRPSPSKLSGESFTSSACVHITCSEHKADALMTTHNECTSVSGCCSNVLSILVSRLSCCLRMKKDTLETELYISVIHMYGLTKILTTPTSILNTFVGKHTREQTDRPLRFAAKVDRVFPSQLHSRQSARVTRYSFENKSADVVFCKTVLRLFHHRSQGRSSQCLSLTIGRTRRNNCMAPGLARFESAGFFLVRALKKCGVCYCSQRYGGPTAASCRWMPGHSEYFKDV